MKHNTARIQSFAFVDEDHWARSYTDEAGVRRCAESGARFVGCRCHACSDRKAAQQRYQQALTSGPRSRRHLRLV
jgi:hypothetical protein